MAHLRPNRRACRSIVAAWVGALLVGCAAPPTPESSAPFPAPTYGDPFWSHWGDGRAELAAYALTYPRYGAPRDGTAVAIWVTETFGNRSRVKIGEGPDGFPVLKLNLVQDFPTGVYDYNLMTSVFVALEPVNGRLAGTPTKVSFSSQEWCGQTWAQALFDARDLRWQSHSYFEGEADATGTLAFPADGVAEDALPFWARGLAGPLLEPGERREVPLLRSFERVRLDHLDVAWQPATLARAAEGETLDVPAGQFEVERRSASVAGGPTWEWWVEREAPHRIVRWARSDGLLAELLGSERMAYWKMNGPGFEAALEALGLTPRPPRTP